MDSTFRALAERRTDIFGVGDEETAIGKKIGEEERRKDEGITTGGKWDAPSAPKEDLPGSSFRTGPPAGLVTLQVCKVLTY